MASPSRRTSPLPRHWQAIRVMVLRRDGHRCTWIENDRRCGERTKLEVDHIGDAGDHRLPNLRTLCRAHHASRTGKQARGVQLDRGRRPVYRHHGLRNIE